MSIADRLTALRLRTAGLDAAAIDPGTEEGRSRLRYRRAAQATAVNLVSRVLSIGVLFISIRLVGGALDPDAFGLWLLLVTALGLVGFADLGIGNGLLNVVAHAQGRDDQGATRQAISSAFLALVALAFALAGGFALVYPHVSWASLLNVTGASADQVGPAVAVFVGCVVLSLPLGLAQRVNHAHQLGWIANGWVGMGNLFSLAAVIVAVQRDATLPVIVAASLGGAPLAYLLDSIVLFGFQRRDLRPRVGTATIAAVRHVLSRGGLFFVLATVGAVSYEADSLVISHFLGASAVQVYAVPFRLFMLAPALVTVIVGPLWPAYGEAVGRGDFGWMHRTLLRSLGLGAAITLASSLVLVVLAQPIIDLWVRGVVTPPTSLLLGLGVWAVLNGVSVAMATFFNGAGILRIQVVVAVVMGIANLGLSIALVNAIGVAGPVWGTVITQLVIGMVPGWIVIRGLVRHHDDPEAMRRWLHRWAGPSAPAEAQ